MALTFVLRPLSEGFYTTWTLGAGSTKTSAVDPGDPVAHDDATSYITVATPTATAQSFLLRPLRPEIAVLNSVQAFVRWRNTGTPSVSQEVRIFARVNGTDTSDFYLQLDNNNGTFGNGDVSGVLPGPGGGSWSIEQILSPTLELGAFIPGASWVPLVATVDITTMYILLTYEPVPTQIGQAREIASRRLRNFRRRTGILQVRAPLAFLDTEVLDECAVSHFAGPEAAGLGWGTKKWQRRLFRVIRSEVDPGSMTVLLTLRDLRQFLVSYWDEARSLKTSGPTHDGIARLDPGCTRSFLRNSDAWVEDPADGRVVQVQEDTEKIDVSGMLLESFSNNYLPRSSFKNGLTGITPSGDGVNGSVLDLDPDDLLFESSITPNSLRWTAGNPHAADLVATWAATQSITANTVVRVSIDHKDDSGATITWRLQRAVDSNYWNDTTGAWGAGAVDNALTVRTTKFRDISAFAINVGASNTTLTFSMRQLSGGTADRRNHVYHCQIESLRWVTSRIVTEASTVARELEALRISNNTGLRSWTNARGTARFEFVPSWNAADMDSAAGFPNFFTLDYDANNSFKLYYNGSAASRLDFDVETGGATVSARIPFTPVRGTTYRIAVRWVSAEGELNLTPYTISVFLDGVKGTDAVASAMPTEASPSNLFIGGNNVDWACNGALRHIEITQQVLTDQEIARGL